MSETISSAPASTGRGYQSLAVAGAGVALAASALLSARPAKAVTPALKFSDIPGTGNVKVLNYALALETLEADFYVQALQRLTGGGTNALGTVIPGLNLATTEPDVRYVQEFGTVERQHRDFLNTTLTALNNQSIIGSGANGILANAQFNFGIETMTRQQVIDTLYTIENTGTSAYLGAINFFTDKTYLLVAGGIQATEARHTATVAIVSNLLFGPKHVTAPLVGQSSGPTGGVTNTVGIDGTLAPDTVLAAVSPYIVLPAA